MTKAQIKARIEKLSVRLDALRWHEEDAEVKRLRAKVEAVEEKLRAAEHKAFQKAKPEITSIEKEIAQLKLELKKPGARSLAAPIPKDALPEKALAILNHAYGRVVEASKYQFIWISPKEKYAIMYVKGHTFYSNRFSPNSYSPSQFGLVDLSNEQSSPYGHDCILHHEGRFTKSIFKQFTDKAQELEGS